jgi:DNA-binding CsgD family transcriptional regulator
VAIFGGEPRDRDAVVDALSEAGWSVDASATASSGLVALAGEERPVLVLQVLPPGDAARAEARGIRSPVTDTLTPREREVLAALAEGGTDVAIAHDLAISVSTVRSHLDRIREKTGRRRRSELTRLAIEARILPVPPSE